MRETVAVLKTAHSFMRMTFQPADFSFLETLLSLRRFVSILFRQNSVFERGRYLPQLVHPCQKHPSTNTASLRPGHAKSGLPKTGHCLR